MNKLTTSKLISVSSCSRSRSQIRCANSEEFFTNELVDPARGERILVSILATGYVGDPMAETIGQSGVSSLWILGRPYIWGGLEHCGVRNFLSLSDMHPLSSSFFNSLLILVSILVVGSLLIRCRENGLIPNGLWVSLPDKLDNQKKSREIARKASEALLRALISDIRTKRARMESEINIYTLQLRELTCEEQVTSIKRWCSEAAEKTSLETSKRQKVKFKHLRLKKHGNGTLDPKRVVKNMSSGTLSKDGESWLWASTSLWPPSASHSETS